MPSTQFVNMINEAGRVTTQPAAQLRVLEKHGWREATDDEVAAAKEKAAAPAVVAEEPDRSELEFTDDVDTDGAAWPTPSEED